MSILVVCEQNLRYNSADSSGCSFTVCICCGPYLVEPEVDPGDEEAGEEHGAVGPLDEADGPEDEGGREEGEGDVAVGDLADGRAVQDVVGHHLLHRHRHARQVTGQALKP